MDDQRLVFFFRASLSGGQDIYKSNPQSVTIEGTALTERRDLDGEIIIAKGADVSDLTKINFNHLSVFGTEYIIGDIVEKSIEDGKLFIRATLNASKKVVKTILKSYDEETGLLSGYGFSVEGKSLERQKKGNTTFINKCKLYQVAITPLPANPDCNKVFLVGDAYDSQKDVIASSSVETPALYKAVVDEHLDIIKRLNKTNLNMSQNNESVGAEQVINNQSVSQKTPEQMHQSSTPPNPYQVASAQPQPTIPSMGGHQITKAEGAMGAEPMTPAYPNPAMMGGGLHLNPVPVPGAMNGGAGSLPLPASWALPTQPTPQSTPAVSMTGNNMGSEGDLASQGTKVVKTEEAQAALAASLSQIQEQLKGLTDQVDDMSKGKDRKKEKYMKEKKKKMEEEMNKALVSLQKNYNWSKAEMLKCSLQFLCEIGSYVRDDPDNKYVHSLIKNTYKVVKDGLMDMFGEYLNKSLSEEVIPFLREFHGDWKSVLDEKVNESGPLNKSGEESAPPSSNENAASANENNSEFAKNDQMIQANKELQGQKAVLKTSDPTVGVGAAKKENPTILNLHLHPSPIKQELAKCLGVLKDKEATGNFLQRQEISKSLEGKFDELVNAIGNPAMDSELLVKAINETFKDAGRGDEVKVVAS